VIGLSAQAKDDVLAIFRGPLMCGLFEGEDEVVDVRYTRLPIEFSPPLEDGDLRYIENVNEVRFNDMGRDHVIDHWGVFDGQGLLRARYRLIREREVPADDNPVFRSGNLKIGIP
jgi:hypothetical protein